MNYNQIKTDINNLVDTNKCILIQHEIGTQAQDLIQRAMNDKNIKFAEFSIILFHNRSIIQFTDNNLKTESISSNKEILLNKIKENDSEYILLHLKRGGSTEEIEITQSLMSIAKTENKKIFAVLYQPSDLRTNKPYISYMDVYSSDNYDKFETYLLENMVTPNIIFQSSFEAEAELDKTVEVEKDIERDRQVIIMQKILNTQFKNELHQLEKNGFELIINYNEMLGKEIKSTEKTFISLYYNDKTQEIKAIKTQYSNTLLSDLKEFSLNEIRNFEDKHPVKSLLANLESDQFKKVEISQIRK